MMKKSLFLLPLIAAIILAVLDFKEMVNREAEVASFRAGSNVKNWPRDERIANRRLSPVREPVSQNISATSVPVQFAEQYLLKHSKELDLKPYHQFKPIELRSPIVNTVKFSVSQDGIPIIGISLTFRFDPNGRLLQIDNQYRGLEKADTNPRSLLSIDEVLEKSLDQYSMIDTNLDAVPMILFATSTSERPELAYVLTVKEKTGERRPLEVVFRATDGQILAKSAARK